MLRFLKSEIRDQKSAIKNALILKGTRALSLPWYHPTWSILNRSTLCRPSSAVPLTLDLRSWLLTRSLITYY